MQHTTQHSTGLLETMTVVQLVMKLLTFMNPLKFSTLYKTAGSQSTISPVHILSAISHTVSSISLPISAFLSYLLLNIPHSPFHSIYWLKFYIHLSIYVGQTNKMDTFFHYFVPIKFHCFTVHFDSLDFIHTNSCTFSYNHVLVF